MFFLVSLLDPNVQVQAAALHDVHSKLKNCNILTRVETADPDDSVTHWAIPSYPENDLDVIQIT